MIIPWNTDAPLYYFPWATLGLIVTNTAVLAGLMTTGAFEGEAINSWLLVYGHGLHPLQWVTSAFIHQNIVHLIGNMIFLWAFGLVVEGKLGWWRFLLLYLGLGIVQNFAEQSMTFWFTEGSSCGASAIIFGLMAMALVWAPENEMSCLGWFFFFRPFVFEIRILWLALLYIVEEVVWVVFSGFSVSSELFHAMGAVLGTGVALMMLKMNLVDCEGWDLLSVIAGKNVRGSGSDSVGRRQSIDADELELESEGDGVLSLAQRREQALQPMRRLLGAGKGTAALALYHKTVHICQSWELPEKELLQLAELLCGEKHWHEAVLFLEDYLRRFQKRVIPVRLRLAQILIEQQRRPSYAVRILAELPRDGLGLKEEKLRTVIASKAQKLIDEGVLELEGRAW